MTILADPPAIIATAPYPPGPTDRAASNPWHSSRIVRTLASSRRRQPVDAPATTRRLLVHQRDRVPADDPDRAMLATQLL
jgi:hypothetical protein